MAKRSLDLLLSGVALLLLWPVLLLLVLLVKRDSPGPALFTQKRVGRNERYFTIYKFRTMVWGTPDLPTDRMKDAANRITRVGRFLRRTSLDELPQLWNILIGDMSIVGPRPALYNQDELIELRRQAGVHVLRPGLTGWAQVNGRDDVSDYEKTQLDAYYLQHQSLLLDAKILWLTLRAVFAAEGIRH